MTFLHRAVFFDLDETLRLRQPTPTDGFVQFLRQEGLHIGAENVRALKRWVHQYWADDERVSRDMAHHGKEAFRLHYSGLLVQAAGLSKSCLPNLPRRVHHWFYNEYAPQVQRAPGSLRVLKQLKAAGMVLGLISNRREPLDNAVSELGLGGLFDLTLAAGEVGHWKPDPALFDAALRRSGELRAQECIYVGDNYHADVVGAARAGLTPILFDPDHLYDSAPFQRIQNFDELTAVLP